LGFKYPPGLYSLSHVALPFPMTDSLYGLTPDSTEDFGLNLGALAPRGERNVLIASLDSLLRASSNPFFPYMIDRIDEGIDGRGFATKPTAASAPVAAPGPETADDAAGWHFTDIFSDVEAYISGSTRSGPDPPDAP
jgi:hypothetical protein